MNTPGDQTDSTPELKQAPNPEVVKLNPDLFAETNRALDLQVQSLVSRKETEAALHEPTAMSDYPAQNMQRLLAETVSSILEEISPTDVTFKPVRADLRAKGMGDFTLDIPKLKENRPGDTKGDAIGRYIKTTLPLLLKELPLKSPFPIQVKQAGVFLNVFVDNPKLRTDLLNSVETMGDSFGDSDIFKGQRFVLDYSSPNMGKPMHVGHLRTTVIGQAISNLLNRTGAIVYAVNHIGDWGTLFGHLTTAYKTWGEELSKEIDPEKEPMDFLSALYVKVRKAIKTEKDAQNGQSRFEEQGRINFGLLEARDPETVALWKKFNDWSMVELGRVYKRLGISFDIYLGESFYTDALPGMIQAVKDVGLAESGFDEKSLILEFGERENANPDEPNLQELKNQLRALHIQLRALKQDETGDQNKIKEIEEQISGLDKQANERRILPLCMLQKGDGGSVYLTRDIAAIRYRIKNFKADKIVYVIGSEQKLHMQQVFETSRRIGDIPKDRCTHVSFGLIKKPDGSKVSSREGAGGLLGLLDELRDSAVKLIDTEENRKEISPEEMKEIAEILAKGALIYANFSQDRERDMIFDPDNMLSINHQTGPYLQYSAVRMGSLLVKMADYTNTDNPPNNPPMEADMLESIDPVAIEVLESLGQFPQVIAESASRNAPHILANYLYDLASTFNKFYTGSKTSIGRLTQIEGPEKTTYIRIIAACNTVLRKGLKLLNIEVPLKM